VESSIAESSKAREKLDEVDAIKEMLEREEERDADADKERGRSGEADGERSERKDRERERGREGEQGGRKMTEAERRYEEIQRRRVSSSPHVVCLLPAAARSQLTISQREERVKKSAKMTHKDRVQEFNSKLDKLRWVIDILRDCLASARVSVCVCGLTESQRASR
jgi:protein FAM32A